MWKQEEFENAMVVLEFNRDEDLQRVTNGITSVRAWENIEGSHQKRARVHNLKVSDDGGGRVSYRVAAEWMSHLVDLLHAHQLTGSKFRIVG